ncbi:MAG: ankyrin repeat domain-containing protein [Deltaproteobacteria bacterium]|nr:ankyrin repeat domain-containing protein [Deltaproteobacteria bacterium]
MLGSLHKAIRANDYGHVVGLLDAGADVRALDEEGRSPLCLAADAGFLEIASVLIERGADPNQADVVIEHEPDASTRLEGLDQLVSAVAAGLVETAVSQYAGSRDVEGARPIHAAATGGHLAVLDLLLKSGARAEVADGAGGTPLIYAAVAGQLDCMKRLLAAGADLDAVMATGVSALELAAQKEHRDVVAWMLESGTKRHQQMPELSPSVLEIAVSKADLPLIRMLLEHEATLESSGLSSSLLSQAIDTKSEDIAELFMDKSEVNKAGSFGRRPIHDAAERGMARTVAQLAKRGAKLDDVDSKGLTALILGAKSAYPLGVCEALIEAGANLDGVETDSAFFVNGEAGMSGLMVAASLGNEELVDLFLKRGAALDLTDAAGRSALTHAAQNGHEAIVKQLKAAGADASGAKEAALIASVESGDLDATRRLLEEGASPDAARALRPGQSHTALMIAARTGNAGAIELLVKRGAALDKRDLADTLGLANGYRFGGAELIEAFERQGHTLGFDALCHAVDREQDNCVERLLVLGASDRNADGAGRSPLHLAAVRGNVGLIELFLGRGVPVDIADGRKRTPLMSAAAKGHKAAVERLLAAGASVKAKDPESGTAGQLAQRNGHDEIAELLMLGSKGEQAKRPTAKDLNIAIEQKNVALVKKLLEAGADLNKQQGGTTPLCMAILMELDEAVRLLLDKGADPNLAQKDGETPLMGAAAFHEKAALLLLERGADPKYVSKRQETALSRAVNLGHISIKVVKALLDAGADPNVHAKLEAPILSLAVEAGRADVAELLVKAGAKLDAKDQGGLTALHMLAQSQKPTAAIAKLLVEAGGEINAKDKEGYTPLARAHEWNNKKAVKILKDLGGKASKAEKKEPEEEELASMRGVATFDTNESEIFAKAEPKKVAEALGALLGLEVCLDVLGKEVPVSGVSLLVYRLEGHSWTTIEAFGGSLELGPTRGDAESLSKKLKIPVVFYEGGDTAGIWSYEIFEKGKSVESMQVGDFEMIDYEAEMSDDEEEPEEEGFRFKSTRRKLDEADIENPLEFINETLTELDLFVPGMGLWRSVGERSGTVSIEGVAEAHHVRGKTKKAGG